MFGINKKNGDNNKKKPVGKGKGKDDNKNSFKKNKDQNKDAKKSTNTLSAIPDLICKSYADGCLLLGCVHDVSRNELIVSLPGIENFGFIKLNNISSVYTELLKNSDNEEVNLTTLPEMYSKGNLLRCKVLNYTNKKLYLTIEPEEINSSLNFKSLEDNMIISGAVKTKEDHGFIVDLGFDGLTGFYKTSESNLPLGQCILFKLISKISVRTIKLELCDSTKESSFYVIEKKYNFNSYLPGAKLKCTVEKKTKNGYQVNISNELFAYIHSNHLPLAKREPFLSAKKKDKSIENIDKDTSSHEYKNGEKICGTIIFMNPYSKVVYLSLLPHLTDSTKVAKITKLFLDTEENLKLGQVIKSAQVALHTYKGIYVRFKGENSKQVTGFIPKRHLFEKMNDQEETAEKDDSDEDDDGEKTKKKTKKDAKNMNKEDLETQFPLKSNLEARIYDFSLIEDIILLSHRKSVIETPFLFYHELSVGQVLKCKVRGINTNNGGVNCVLSDFISGFIPKIHTGDVPLNDKLVLRKIKKGADLKCKIIQLDPSEKRCVLTAKKTLIKSPLPLIDSFDNLILGEETMGTVVSIQSYGLLLSFLNDLKGLLPRNQISTSEVVRSETYDLKEIYYVGQLIRCKVFRYDRNRKQVKLSLIMKDAASDKVTDEDLMAKDKEENKKPKSDTAFVEEYKIGDLIESAIITQVNEQDQYFRVKLPRGQKNGIIYKNHLSDLDCLNDSLFEVYKRQKTLKNVMIIQYSGADKINKVNTKSHYITLKTSLIDQYTESTSNSDIKKSFSELEVNQWHNGWIRKILQNGLLVEMPYNLIGFTSNQEVYYLNELKSSLTNGVSIGQSILIKIGKLFDDKNQFITSIRTRHSLMQTNPLETDFMVNLFKSYLINTQKILKELGSSKKTEIDLSINPISLGNRKVWEEAAEKPRIGLVLKVVVKNFNMLTRQIECAFVDDLNENNESNVSGIAFANSDFNEQDMKIYAPGNKFDALVMAFDPLAKTFCLTIDSKSIKTYKKNFDSKFRSQSAHKNEQVIKAEILYVSQWFCIVGLKAHALGHLALMPLFKNNFTQLDTFSASTANEYSDFSKFNLINETKIKQRQLLNVSTASLNRLENNKDNGKKSQINKDDRHFACYAVGQLGKVCVKFSDSNEMDYTIVVHDLSTLKQNRKSLLRQLSILNENHSAEADSNNKRKLNGNDEPILIKKKLTLEKKQNEKKRKLSETNGNQLDSIEVVADIKNNKKIKAVNGEKSEDVEFPWEVTDFDQFNKILNSLNPNENESDNDSDNENSTKKSKKSKKTKTKKEFVDDKNLTEIEEKAFDPNRSPETIDDYERMLIATPNSSWLWIKYMAYHLQIGEVEKARDVAHKGLKTVIYNEEGERMNVWVALLNMENMYGTQANIDDSFNRANQNCDSFKIHSHMAEIYARTDKLKEAEDIFTRMTKKFANRQQVWIKYAIFHYNNKNCELARKLLIRSLGSLDKKEHVEMVNKFAQLEFKFGDIERAKTMYDSLLFTYSNRTDIWSVYIDMLVKHEKIEDARAVLNRIVGLGLTVKRMKFIFKKFLDFEKANGNGDLIEKVKELAAKYAENNNNGSKSNDQNENNENKNLETSLRKNLEI